MTRILLLAGLLSAVVAIFLATRGEEARAAGPCGTTHDAVDAEEQQFLGLLQAWRLQNVSNEPMEMSGALNRAAAWFAEYQVTNSAFGNHNDSSGRNWAQRAIDCGYTAKLTNGIDYWAQGSGEGIFGAATGGAAVGPAAALAGMLSQQGSQSGIFITGSPPNFPAKCYGAAVYRSGAKVAWVVVIAQLPFNQSCPGGSGGGPPSTTTTTSTATATATPTRTPTPSPTPSPTPTPRGDGATVILYEGWNLVTLPSGPVAAVLHRAKGCYGAIYQQQGGGWLRYAPEVPAWANNLQTLNGGAFWVEGTAENCGLVQL